MLAAKLCRQHIYDPTLEYQLCAVIVRGGRILSVGFNSRSNSALQEFYKDKSQQDHSTTLHSEVAAVLGARRKIDLNGAKIYVVRRLACDTAERPVFGMARPCITCQTVLFKYGIKKMVYTIPNGWSVEKILEPNL